MVNSGELDFQRGEKTMSKGQQRKEAPAETSVRATISFPSALYQTLEEIARQKKVSLAWVVRDAAEQYISEKWPLFKGQV
jgi:predicted DNA-binding ribbon-helix-helix protein